MTVCAHQSDLSSGAQLRQPPTCCVLSPTQQASSCPRATHDTASTLPEPATHPAGPAQDPGVTRKQARAGTSRGSRGPEEGQGSASRPQWPSDCRARGPATYPHQPTARVPRAHVPAGAPVTTTVVVAVVVLSRDIINLAMNTHTHTKWEGE